MSFFNRPNQITASAVDHQLDRGFGDKVLTRKTFDKDRPPGGLGEREQLLGRCGPLLKLNSFLGPDIADVMHQHHAADGRDKPAVLQLIAIGRGCECESYDDREADACKIGLTAWNARRVGQKAVRNQA